MAFFIFLFSLVANRKIDETFHECVGVRLLPVEINCLFIFSNTHIKMVNELLHFTI